MKKNVNNITVFTDGSCIRRKGQPIKAGYGIHFPNQEINDISHSFSDNPTNQRAELYAIYKAIKKVASEYEFNTLDVYTDSKYAIGCLTVWIDNWKKNSWKGSKNAPVLNQDIIKKTDNLLQAYKNKICFHHVRSHTGKDDFESQGNAIADLLATQGSLHG